MYSFGPEFELHGGVKWIRSDPSHRSSPLDMHFHCWVWRWPSEYFWQFVRQPANQSLWASGSTAPQQAVVVRICYWDVAAQSGGDDCGCYAIAFAEALCRGEDPVSLDFKQSGMRAHLLSCLRKGTFTPFPAESRQVSAGVKKVTDLAIYCHCRQPETKRMIKCHSCLEWYHSTCENIESGHWKKPSTWRCKNCA